MRFCVRVPVLSEQMQVVEPRVSTASRFFTSTDFFAMRFAVNERLTVTVARRPSGTLATIIPMAKIKFLTTPYPNAKPRIRNKAPKPRAIQVINLMKISISWAIGVYIVSATVARFAILPITVESPVLNTIPSPTPVVHMVPKNATFGDSKTFFSFDSTTRRRSSDSPVRLALLTFISLAMIRTTSAGMLSPPLIWIKSPGTS